MTAILLHEEEFKSKEYRTWQRIYARCHDPNHHKYPWYGGRGIAVCERWRESYRAFLHDMGRAPAPEYTIERKENDGDYEPGNCRWATMKEQAQNRRSNRNIKFRGRTLTAAAWAEEMGMDRRVLWKRLKARWSVERALTTPKAARKKQEPRREAA